MSIYTTDAAGTAVGAPITVTVDARDGPAQRVPVNLERVTNVYLKITGPGVIATGKTCLPDKQEAILDE
jgi:hypothetical protein